MTVVESTMLTMTSSVGSPPTSQRAGTGRSLEAQLITTSFSALEVDESKALLPP